MNLVGKIFVVLILVMSLVFMGFAVAVYATHKNWMDAVNRPEASEGKPLGLKPQLDRALALEKQRRDELDALKNETKSLEVERQASLKSLQSTLDELRRTHDELQNSEATLKQSERQAVLATQNAQNMLDAALAQIDKLRTDIAESYAERDKTFKDSVALTDKLIEAESEVERLKNNKIGLLARMAAFKMAAEKQGVNINASVDNIPPKLDGIVLASSSSGLIEISLGSDDGVQRGHEAFISRNQGGESKFVAKIEIVKTTPDKSVGKVIPSYRKGPVERGDRVVTKLP
jgi:multidrug efflux pump subunit AcrA (membrane-fusion protein)